MSKKMKWSLVAAGFVILAGGGFVFASRGKDSPNAADQLPFRLGGPELHRATHNISKCVHLFALLVDQQPRILNNVDEQDVPDFKFHL